METGIIFDLKEFAVFDGPGMRQTVFFKGCPLRCSWCHNPEGLQQFPQLMVSSASCIHCGKCKAVCREKTCIACGACVLACPRHLRRIAGVRMTSDELVKRLRKDSKFYAGNDGGVTFSGGEPLMQPAFLLEVLQKLPDLHRAIETSGYCVPAVFDQIIQHLNYCMMDIKIFDGQKHKKYTGADNHVILQNASTLCEGTLPFIIRIPVIPGVNDQEDNYRKTAAFLQGAKALERVEFLPYHKTAGAKYQMIGMDYHPAFDPDESIWISQKIFEEYGIRSEVL